MVEFAVSVLALAIATLALVVASRQYRLDRSASGGRALVFSTGRTGKIAQPFRFENGRIVEEPEYMVFLAVGGPGVFHNVSVHVLGVVENEHGVGVFGDDEREPMPPPTRPTMTLADPPTKWRFNVPDIASAAGGWVVVTWLRPHLEGVVTEAVARWLHWDRLYQWRWFHPRFRSIRRSARNWARRHPRVSSERLRKMPVHGRWELKRPDRVPRGELPVGKPPPPPVGHTGPVR